MTHAYAGNDLVNHTDPKGAVMTAAGDALIQGGIYDPIDCRNAVASGASSGRQGRYAQRERANRSSAQARRSLTG